MFIQFEYVNNEYIYVTDLFDIPVYESKIQSLHTFFTLYSTMKKTQVQLNEAQKISNEHNDI